MQNQDYLKLLVEQLYSTTVATLGADGHPQTRVIDMMLWDAQGMYFLTARGKAFYAQLMEQEVHCALGHAGKDCRFPARKGQKYWQRKAGRDF